MNRVQVDISGTVLEAQAPPPTNGEQLPRRVYIRRSVELARYGYTDQCIGYQHARLGLKLSDHNEECRARIVRHMTADDNLNKRVRGWRTRFCAGNGTKKSHQQQFEQ